MNELIVLSIKKVAEFLSYILNSDFARHNHWLIYSILLLLAVLSVYLFVRKVRMSKSGYVIRWVLAVVAFIAIWGVLMATR